MSIAAPTLNSVSITGDTATLSITPPTDAAYSICQIFYKKFGHSEFTVGSTYVGTQSVAGNATQSGLLANTLYQFMILAADSSSRYSLPSNIKAATSASTIAENNLFIANAITLLSNSTNFQTWTRKNTAELAEEHIFDREVSVLNRTIYYPLALVYDEDDDSTQIDTDNFLKNTNITIDFYQEIQGDRDRDIAKICRDFMDTMGKITQDLENIQGIDSFLSFKKMRKNGEPRTVNLTGKFKNKNDLIMIGYTLEAGH